MTTLLAEDKKATRKRSQLQRTANNPGQQIEGLVYGDDYYSQHRLPTHGIPIGIDEIGVRLHTTSARIAAIQIRNEMRLLTISRRQMFRRN